MRNECVPLKEGRGEVFLFVCFSFNLGGFFWEVMMQGWGAIWRDWEVSWIRVHDVKFPNNQQRIITRK